MTDESFVELDISHFLNVLEIEKRSNPDLVFDSIQEKFVELIGKWFMFIFIYHFFILSFFH
jgi:hypothetical protein